MVSLLSEALRAEPRAAKPLHGYREAMELRADDRRVAVVMWGGQNEGCHVVSTGQDAADLSQALSVSEEPFRVSRADVCIDVEVPGAFDLLAAELRAVAVQSGLELQLQQDPERPEKGRTLYVGSRKSRGFVRLYEKGKKDDPSRPDWVRFEVELKPGDAKEKLQLAELSPFDALGVVRWVRVFVAAQFEFAAAAAPVRLENTGDDERTAAALVRQYGRLLAREARRAGSWEQLGVDLRKRITGE